MRRGLPLLLCAVLLAHAGGVQAAEPGPANASALSETDAAWAARLADAQARRTDARQRVIAGERTVTRARHRKHPRGEALAALERNLEQAREELAAAEAELPVLLEHARRAGVSRAVLDRFEDESESE